MAMRPSETSSSETVRKAVRATLGPWIWPVYGRPNEPKSPFWRFVGVLRRGCHRDLFGHIRSVWNVKFSEVRLLGMLRGAEMVQGFCGYPVGGAGGGGYR